MARQKRAEDETAAQADERRLMEKISNTANRSDKVSWNRKMDNMIKLVGKVNGLQGQIQTLELEKEPVLDDIAVLRATMINECVHPYDQLVFVEGNVSHCKFCDRNIAANGS